MADMKLKNCPCCGKEAVVEVQRVQDTRIYGFKNPWAVHCMCCGAIGSKNTDKDKAIKAWNQRATDSTIEAQEAEIKRLNEIIFQIVECVEMNGHGFVTADRAYLNIRKVVEDYGLRIDASQAALAEKGE